MAGPARLGSEDDPVGPCEVPISKPVVLESVVSPVAVPERVGSVVSCVPSPIRGRRSLRWSLPGEPTSPMSAPKALRKVVSSIVVPTRLGSVEAGGPWVVPGAPMSVPVGADCGSLEGLNSCWSEASSP